MKIHAFNSTTMNRSET